jgi:nucleoid-associated protein YgaU
MGRYGNTSIFKQTKKYSKDRKINVDKYGTTMYNKVPESNDDMYFIAQSGDRCDTLAKRFYGDTSLWWFIARANNLKTMNIPAGTSLRIPTSTENAKGF